MYTYRFYIILGLVNQQLLMEFASGEIAGRHVSLNADNSVTGVWAQNYLQVCMSFLPFTIAATYQILVELTMV